jgi:hypothetical protein
MEMSNTYSACLDLYIIKMSIYFLCYIFLKV